MNLYFTRYCHRLFFVTNIKATTTNPIMSEKMTPAEVLNSVAEGINTGNLDSLMTLYEADACFASQPGQLAKSPESVRQSLRSFIDLKGKLDLKVKKVLQASDLALVTTEWSFSGTGPDGNPVSMAAKSADVLRHQADGTWRFVIDNPWGTD
jgi:uncharacterized protein (TIGR02246 family)